MEVELEADPVPVIPDPPGLPEPMGGLALLLWLLLGVPM